MDNNLKELEKRYKELYDEDLSSVVGGSERPLIILDGIQTELLGGIDPKDIESIQILKDASSTAIYGARGANGVIMVETGNKEQ